MNDLKQEAREIGEENKGRLVNLTYHLEHFIDKSEAQEKERILKLLTKEINIAHQEGTPTARLTSLYNKIN